MCDVSDVSVFSLSFLSSRDQSTMGQPFDLVFDLFKTTLLRSKLEQHDKEYLHHAELKSSLLD